MTDPTSGNGPWGDPPDGPPDDPRYPLMTDRPGVEVTDPIRKVRMLALVWAAALLIGCAAAAYVATTIANHRSEEKIAAANRKAEELVNAQRAEMDRRARARDAQAATALRILEQNRRTICELLKDDTSGRVEVTDLRRAYACGTARTPIVPLGWTPPPGWPPLPGSQ